METKALSLNPGNIALASCLVVCVVALWACGDSGEYDDPYGNEPTGAFELTVSGDLNEPWSAGVDGFARYHLNGPEGYCFIGLADVRANNVMHSIFLYFKGLSCPEPGTYNVVDGQSEANAGEFWGLGSATIGDAQRMYTAQSGTIEISSRRDGLIVGNLTVSLIGFVDASHTLSAAGNFEAVPELVQLP